VCRVDIKPTIKEEVEAPKKKSAESSKGGVSKMERAVDYNNLTNEDIVNMNDDEFDEYSKSLEGKQSRLTIFDDKGNRVTK
jgi:hypothetical protein